MISVTHSGSFKHLEALLNCVLHNNPIDRLDRYGQMGVEALREATPKDTGLTADSWSYEIKRERDGATITWSNSNVQNGLPIAVILQYGHATGNGGYVKGVDYINPALRSVFQNLADTAWEEVSKS